MNFVTVDFIAVVAKYKFLLNHFYKQHVVSSIHNFSMKHYQQLSFKLITIMHSFANRVHQLSIILKLIYNSSVYCDVFIPYDNYSLSSSTILLMKSQ